MKILVLSHYWHPQNGIPQRRWQWLTSVLREAGHEVDVIAPPRKFRRNMGFAKWIGSLRELSSPLGVGEEGESGEQIFRTVALPSTSSLTTRVVSQASVAVGQLCIALLRCRKGSSVRPDVIVATVPALPTAVVACIVGRLLTVPYVIDLRDAWPDLLQESARWNESLGAHSWRQKVLSKGPLQLVKAMTKVGLDFALLQANGVVATSSWLRNDLAKKKEVKGRNAEPCLATVRNVFPREIDFVKRAKSLRDSSELNVLYAGTIGRAQDLENVLQAAKIAKEQGVKINLRFIGAGDGKKRLIERAQQLGVEARFEKQRSVDEMLEPYLWADTALVHLANWEPLERTVPSKTYELMEAKIHISAVVKGETAEIVESVGAGDVVAPDSPAELVALWRKLIENPHELKPAESASAWVSKERNEVAEANFLGLLEGVLSGDES